MEQYVLYAKEKGFSVKHAVLRMDNQADFSTPTMQRFYKQHGITVLSGGPNEHEAQHTVENLDGVFAFVLIDNNTGMIFVAYFLTHTHLVRRSN